jgi:hypothetical protein
MVKKKRRLVEANGSNDLPRRWKIRARDELIDFTPFQNILGKGQRKISYSNNGIRLLLLLLYVARQDSTTVLLAQHRN